MTTSINSQLQLVDAATVQKLIEQQKIQLIDVREPSEYAAEHIPNAQLLPLSKFQIEQVSLTQGKEIVIYCLSGNRSNQAAKKLLNAGFTEFKQLEGGITAWKQSGYPTQLNKNAPISLMRQMQIVAGTLVFTGTVLGAFISPWFLILSGFVGTGLVFAGVTNTCAMGMLLAKLPYNQQG
ncbi:rhodanese-like domain-containing protein [Anabaena cylindrica FACHB-243]|uniref:Rhodanese-like protein n=1 Tax=Anabaena cylindrica (strain ATCC 27899 / PCC 7122) TaxID=272123 RepID=K9ZFA3_ANACC|nr:MULTISPECIES: rhodanese-like domain-containing protein [Anabaena]AFZ57898.1 Rhodanese-like protein [Anabaena cylindrica PCC 7122]MBD2419746.1 rhodanese-like domain-containing protein [Anabaena cylindrica FACHB-243]MBY5281550.1 rhodanese-like domain-containing protein [Anabaena sp. CCAP 1446/1C]MBY5307197.1 rhodanese-like domain-containing protein [Anabaena sp. CCAP 1446/1C]MCM2405560.1 rhodanese-like domain-containing protein [Anabaena sp. CCAP 1446/1C]